jgi:hypothetical protein
MNFESFCESLRQEVLFSSEQEDGDLFREERFLEIASDYLSQAGEANGIEPASYDSGDMRISGYSVYGDGEFLDLYTVCYTGKTPPKHLPEQEPERNIKKIAKFFEESAKGLYKRIEESSPVFDLAQQISQNKNDISKLRFILLSDAEIGSLPEKQIEINGCEAEIRKYDIRDLYQIAESKSRREAVEISIRKEFDREIPFIKIDSAKSEYACYLCTFPGKLLADIYGKYGPALLEKNVRSFLQVRGKINKSIRETILDEPQRFLAYNNGIAAVADEITVANGREYAKIISKITNLQIVNGGQTTASIFHAIRNDEADVSSLDVQVKITVIKKKELFEHFVPKISQYANSQNKINIADFSANDAFNKKIEELSRSVWTPEIRISGKKTQWFYERVRGQYAEFKSGLSPAKQKAFDAVNPLGQKFTKTDMAKYINAWAQLPYHVCRGAEINYQEFVLRMRDEWKPVLDEAYYKNLIAKAILFRKTDDIIAEQDFGGYKSQITAYTMALLSHLSAQMLDLNVIWEKQELPSGLEIKITDTCGKVKKHIWTPEKEMNISEWCKREKCWTSLIEGEKNFNIDLESWKTAKENIIAVVAEAGGVGGARTAEEIAEIEEVSQVAADIWFSLAKWGKETNSLPPWHRRISFSLGLLAQRGAKPSPKQARQGIIIIRKAKDLGFL